MTSRRQLVQKGQVYGQLDKILSAMKAFAYAEVRKLEGEMGAHRDLLAHYRDVIQCLLQMGGLLPTGQQDPLVIVIGTERGFCGDINQRLATRIRRIIKNGKTDLVVLGSRLAYLLEDMETLARLDGASNAEDVEPCVEKLMAVLLQKDRPYPLANTRILLYDYNSEAIQELALLRDTGDRSAEESAPEATTAPGPEPLSAGGEAAFGTAHPLLYQDPASMLATLLPEYVFLMIHYCVRSALLGENHRRLTQMDSATRHLGEISQKLSIKSNQLRQEAIIEEIEAHVATGLLDSDGFDSGPG